MDIVIIASIIIIAVGITIEAAALIRSLGKNAKMQPQITVFVPLVAEMPDIEYVLRQIVAMVRSSNLHCRIMLCNIRADDETLRICQRFADDYDIFELCGINDITCLFHIATNENKTY